MLLCLSDHGRERQTKSLGDTMRYIQTGVAFTALNETDMGVMDVCLLGKELLAQPLCFSVPPNYRAEGQRDAAAIRHRGSKMALSSLRHH